MICDPLGAMEQGWVHAMEWGMWIGRWSVGKHLVSYFCMILGETLGFFVDFFDEFLEVCAEGIDLRN